MWCLCMNCINAIKSRGEKIFVGLVIDPDEYLEENGETLHCEWCDAEDVDIYETIEINERIHIIP